VIGDNTACELLFSWRCGGSEDDEHGNTGFEG
jgi:hypothetical protein